MNYCLSILVMLALIAIAAPCDVDAQVLNKQKLLSEQTFWDNRDLNCYAEHIPFFECPDPGFHGWGHTPFASLRENADVAKRIILTQY